MDGKPKFIRIRGRIVPLKEKKAARIGAGVGAVAGAGIGSHHVLKAVRKEVWTNPMLQKSLLAEAMRLGKGNQRAGAKIVAQSFEKVARITGGVMGGAYGALLGAGVGALAYRIHQKSKKR